MGPANLAMIIPIIAILTPLFMVLAVMYYRHKNMSRLHETVIQLAEKGLPIPHELLTPRREPTSRLYMALSLIGFGIGMIIFFLSRSNWQFGGEWGLGAIPLAIGVAQLIAWRFERKQKNTEIKAGNPWHISSD